MFDYLFNQPRSIWEHAELVYTSQWPISWLAIAFALGALVLCLFLLRLPISGGRRFIIWSLQCALLATVLWMLWQPALRLETMQPGENAIAFLLDHSASMQNKDEQTETRFAAAQTFLQDKSLTSSDLFDATLYSVADNVTPLAVSSATELSPDGTRSALADGLLSVLETVKEQSLAAVVLVSDGANNSGELSSSLWQRIKAANVPVYTVGVGADQIPNDLELVDVSLDAAVSVNTPTTVNIGVRHNGVSTVRLRITSGKQLIHAEELTLDPNQNESQHRVTFNSGEAGVRQLQFTLEPSASESNTQNNTVQRMLQVSEEAKRILYIEGEPRWEYKFIRRAVSAQNALDVVTLLRTSANKFYRQGVKDANELADGFPSTREALFAYDAVIIGSFEAAELNSEQQSYLRDFVAVRGGSLLMLAGPKGLADGGWGRSAVSPALPVQLSSKTTVSDYQRERVFAALSTQGTRTPWLALDEDPIANLDAWSALPALADHQIIGTLKPGASELLSTYINNVSYPLFAWHRYGQGHSFVLGTSGTWRWQMQLPAENQWHEQFWQQLLSHLSAIALPQMGIVLSENVYRDTNTVPITVLARDVNFQPLESGELSVQVTKPNGEQFMQLLQADISHPGRFTGVITAEEEGAYAVNLPLTPVGEPQLVTDSQQTRRWFIKENGTSELFSAGQNVALLKRLASETGGEYWPIAQAGNLADTLATKNTGVTQEQLLPLWHMPILFFILLFGKLLEWLLRLRWQRL